MFFFFKDTPTTAIYTLSLHDALPISVRSSAMPALVAASLSVQPSPPRCLSDTPDRKSTRLNSSHVEISYAVFCLKKKKQKNQHLTPHYPHCTEPASQVHMTVIIHLLL